MPCCCTRTWVSRALAQLRSQGWLPQAFSHSFRLVPQASGEPRFRSWLQRADGARLGSVAQSVYRSRQVRPRSSSGRPGPSSPWLPRAPPRQATGSSSRPGPARWRPTFRFRPGRRTWRHRAEAFRRTGILCQRSAALGHDLIGVEMAESHVIGTAGQALLPAERQVETDGERQTSAVLTIGSAGAKWRPPSSAGGGRHLPPANGDTLRRSRQAQQKQRRLRGSRQRFSSASGAIVKYRRPRRRKT